MGKIPYKRSDYEYEWRDLGESTVMATLALNPTSTAKGKGKGTGKEKKEEKKEKKILFGVSASTNSFVAQGLSLWDYPYPNSQTSFPEN